MMPSAEVYFVKFCSIALIPAALMLSGVGKSGSPVDRLIMDRPLAFSSPARAAMRSVAAPQPPSFVR